MVESLRLRIVFWIGVRVVKRDLGVRVEGVGVVGVEGVEVDGLTTLEALVVVVGVVGGGLVPLEVLGVGIVGRGLLVLPVAVVSEVDLVTLEVLVVEMAVGVMGSAVLLAGGVLVWLLLLSNGAILVPSPELVP
jgi:hypothetical protein